MSIKTILVVDDDPEIQLLFGMHLNKAGYKTWSACDGLSCIGAARRQRPDLILLDLGLPAGDGEMALRSLRALPQFDGTPILVVSGRDEDAWGERVRELGASGYLQKPVDPQRLLVEVGRLLHQPTAKVDRPAGALRSASSQHLQLSCPKCGESVADLSATLTPSSLRALLRTSGAS